MPITKITRAELKERWYRRRFLVPNLVTVGNLFCGFLASIYSISGQFDKAAYTILIAIILDGLDGRVARKLNATSKFGVEFDSFSDLVSFGVAPAIMMFMWCFQTMADEFGVFVTFLFVLCAASRLARFNVSKENLTSFQGCPTPGSAGMVIALIYALPGKVDNLWLVGLGTAVMLSLSYFQVSNIEYPSIKKMRLRSLGIPSRIYLGALFGLIWYAPRVGFLVLATWYAFGGPLKLIYRRYIQRVPRGQETPLPPNANQTVGE